MKRITEEPLIFPIGTKDYRVPPVTVQAGWELAEILANPEKHKKDSSEHLFQLALGSAYDEMVADGVGVHLVFRAGMAACAHFMALNSGGSFENATTAAEGIWESGVDPKDIQEWVKNHQQTRGRRMAAAGASTASTSGTSTRKASTRSTRPRASRSTTSSAKPK